MKLRINNKIYDSFSDYTVNLDFNSIADSFSFNGLNDYLPGILSYADCDVFIENEKIITGYLISTSLNIQPAPSLSSVSGYSKSGILEDCTIPIDKYPLQSNNLTLLQLAEKLAGYYNVKVVYSDNVLSGLNQKIPKITSSPVMNIKQYINNIASQRGIIMSHTAKGELLFTKIDISQLKPINNVQINTLSFAVNGQNLHSQITVFRQSSTQNKNSGEYTINNPYVALFRHATKILNTGENNDLQKAARIELSSQLREFKFSISTNRFIKPNNLIIVDLAAIGMKKNQSLFVESTQINGSAKTENYTLNCVFPEVYALDKPVKNEFIS